MCNRYWIEADIWEREDRLFPLPPDLGVSVVYPKYHGALAYVEDGQIVSATAQWGFEPHWTKSPLNNTKIETVLESPYWKAFVEHGRCIVPCTGFCEWIGEKGSKKALKFGIEGEPAFVFAGICDRRPGKPPTHYSIFTTEPTEEFRQYHHRMPVVMSVSEGLGWLGSKVHTDSMVFARPGREDVLILYPS